MCLALVLRLAEPCAMHERHDASHAGHAAYGAQLVAAGADETCHPADGATGCTSGGACPAGNVAAAAVLAPEFSVPDVPEPAHSARLTAPVSFFAPPLPPPPQA